uniref:NADH-ubiquinone oxidoreductase chain 6 n=1 Tax=Pethia gelius TaxID=496989 RepID=A0A125SX67_9TELE|nr:NADH dehydrogenase subunit 6 [Pethia gelius]
MAHFLYFSFGALVLSLSAVASNPAPYFAAFGLVATAGVGCVVLVILGGSFLALLLFLIYLGGMLVVFAYSTALAAESYPDTLSSKSVMVFMITYLLAVGLTALVFWGGWYMDCWVVVDELGGFSVLRSDTSGVAVIYSFGGGMLFICSWVLLLTLFVVLELTRGLSRNSLRAV